MLQHSTCFACVKLAKTRKSLARVRKGEREEGRAMHIGIYLVFMACFSLNW